MSSTRALQTVCAGLLVLAGALAGCGSGSGGGGGTPPPPSVTTTALADGANAVAYNQSLTASGGSGTLTWSVASGQLPTGLSLSSSGALTGTPTATGVFNFTVQVQDSANPPRTATAALSIRVVTSFVTITNNFFADGITTAAYNQTATATGGASSFTWDISAGALPAGLSISAAGAITGTPTAAGTANFTLRVRDAAGPLQQTVTKALSIRIADQLAIVTASLPDGINGNAYSQTLQASGGNGPFTWSTTAGVLPTGLALSSAGVITGNPGANGTFSFTVRAQDSSNPQQSVTRALSIRVNPLLSVTTSSLPNGTTGTFYNQILVADGGLGSFTWSLATGTLPAGLTLSSAGIISGIPTTAATSNFTVQVGDSSAPPQTATKSLGITIAAAVMNITTSSLPSGVVNASYKVQLAVLGGQMPISWLPVSGTLLRR